MNVSLSCFLFRLYHMWCQGFPSGSAVNNLPAMPETQRCRFNPWVGKTPGGGNGNPLQYSCQENPIDREACLVMVHRVARVRYN